MARYGCNNEGKGSRMRDFNQADLFSVEEIPRTGQREYRNVLTVDINEKGVLDVDTVKGCTAGMSARPGTGCYGGCYAAKIAKFRGIDFSKAITRTVHSNSQARAIEKQVANAPQGFFRIGVMGDPCHAWEETVKAIEWLSEFAHPVVITKHWRTATDDQLRRMAYCGTALNTSISALDTPQELKHRKKEFYRFKLLGGNSVARIVSCKFNEENSDGKRMKEIQDDLFLMRPTLDNPLRVPKNHPLVVSGVILITVTKDISSERTISITNAETYIGHCAGCPDVCGIPKSEQRSESYKPKNPRQKKLW
jgi:hypothetical protein